MEEATVGMPNSRPDERERVLGWARPQSAAGRDKPWESRPERGRRDRHLAKVVGDSLAVDHAARARLSP